MLPMVRNDGVPERSDVIPGMAFFPATGPAETYCGTCRHRGYRRATLHGRWDEALQKVVYKTYFVIKCAMFKSMTDKHGRNIRKETPSCKYYEAKAARRA